MKITADTNLLVRAVVDDDVAQSKLAQSALADAEQVAVPIMALSEFVWVLRSSYRISRADVADRVRRIIETANVLVDRPAAEAGIAMLEAGADFADGVIAHEGLRLGGEVFVSFDKRAVRLVTASGGLAKTP